MKRILFLVFSLISCLTFAQTSQSDALIRKAITPRYFNGIVKQGTIAELRAMSPNREDLSSMYFSTEEGKEGYFKADFSDNSSVDNLGTVLVCQNGVRIKRIKDKVIYPEFFGAVKNNANYDCTNAIQKCIESGYIVSLSPNSTYYTQSTISIPSNCTIEGNGATIKNVNNSISAVFETPEIVLFSQNVNTVVTKGSSTFFCNNPNNIQVGSIIYLKGISIATINTNTYECGWWGQVKHKNGNVITMSTNAPKSFTSPMFTVYKSYSNIQIKDLILDLKGISSDKIGLNLLNVLNTRIDNVNAYSDNLSSSPIVGINITGENVFLSKCNASDFRFTNSGAGYGINVGGHNISIINCTGEGSKHVIAAAGRSWYSSNITIDKCNVNAGRAAAIDLHGLVLNSIISNCTVSTSMHGYYLRSSNVNFINNTCYINGSNSDVRGIDIFEFGGSNTQIQNYKCYIKGVNSSNKAIYITNVLDSLSFLKITDSYIQGQIEIEGVKTEKITIENCDFDGSTGLQSYINLGLICTDYNISNCRFTNNQSNENFNYSINLPSSNEGKGIINNNRFFIKNSGNNNSQIRVNRSGDLISNNVFYSNSLNLISTSQNANLTNNLKIDSTNTYTTVTYNELPIPSKFFLNHLICVSAQNKTRYYIGKQNGLDSFAFIEIPDLSGDVIFSKNIQASKMYAQEGNNASIVIGADNSAQTLSNNFAKSSRIMMPSFLGNSMSNNLITLLYANSDGANNYIRFGGGTGSGINATDIEFYIGSLTNAGPGTRMGKFFPSGNFTLQNGGTFSDTGERLQVAGDIRINGKIKMPIGSNSPVGNATLSNGIATISTTASTTNSLVYTQTKTISGTHAAGGYTYDVQTAGTLIITARKPDGTIETGCNSTVTYSIFN